VVDNGRIEQIFDEEPHIPNFMPDPYVNSTAKQMFAYLESNQPKGRGDQTSTSASNSSTADGQDAAGGQVATISLRKREDALIGARDMIDTIIDQTNANPLFVRLAWHDSGTFDVNVKGEWPAAGGAIGSIRFEPEINHGANAGLAGAVKLLEPVKKAFPAVSYADIFQMASARGVELAGGPAIAMKYGKSVSCFCYCCSLSLSHRACRVK
jgi:Peroxidase